jgi:hypothetical protein
MGFSALLMGAQLAARLLINQQAGHAARPRRAIGAATRTGDLSANAAAAQP